MNTSVIMLAKAPSARKTATHVPITPARSALPGIVVLKKAELGVQGHAKIYEVEER